MMSLLGSQQEISAAVMTPSGSSMTQTLISPDHQHGLQGGTTGGNRAFERREGELVWPEGSVTGIAATYVRGRIAIR
jgi:hypothetical protein